MTEQFFSVWNITQRRWVTSPYKGQAQDPNNPYRLSFEEATAWKEKIVERASRYRTIVYDAVDHRFVRRNRSRRRNRLEVRALDDERNQREQYADKYL